jgi:23S rRNA pseudouridine1911/1915/1917 synthase
MPDDLPPIPVLLRGKTFAVVDKPAGLPVEGDGDSLVRRLSRELAPPGGRAFLRVVHRLDLGTSGCMVVALNDKAKAALEQAFDSGAIEKEYLALVAGNPPAIGALDTPYGPDPKDPRRFTTRLKTPRRARLSFAVAERFALPAALLRVKLETGRTHQIRVQCAEAGFPVLGDPVYGKEAPDPLAIARPALHAARLVLPSPESGEVVACEAPLPADLLERLSSLRR